MPPTNLDPKNFEKKKFVKNFQSIFSIQMGWWVVFKTKKTTNKIEKKFMKIKSLNKCISKMFFDKYL